MNDKHSYLYKTYAKKYTLYNVKANVLNIVGRTPTFYYSPLTHVPKNNTLIFYIGKNFIKNSCKLLLEGVTVLQSYNDIKIIIICKNMQFIPSSIKNYIDNYIITTVIQTHDDDRYNEFAVWKYYTPTNCDHHTLKNHIENAHENNSIVVYNQSTKNYEYIYLPRFINELKLFLICVREFVTDSLFDKDYLCRDMFNLILKTITQ